MARSDNESNDFCKIFEISLKMFGVSSYNVPTTVPKLDDNFISPPGVG